MHVGSKRTLCHSVLPVIGEHGRVLPLCMLFKVDRMDSRPLLRCCTHLPVSTVRCGMVGTGAFQWLFLGACNNDYERQKVSTAQLEMVCGMAWIRKVTNEPWFHFHRHHSAKMLCQVEQPCRIHKCGSTKRWENWFQQFADGGIEGRFMSCICRQLLEIMVGG